MAEQSFSVQASETLESILERLEALPACDDLDMDIIDGVLTVEFEDGAKLIINRQEPLRQLWVASPLGPAHFDFNTQRDAWIDDKTGETLMTTLSKALTIQLGETIHLQD